MTYLLHLIKKKLEKNKENLPGFYEIMTLCFYCGYPKREILSMRIKDAEEFVKPIPESPYQDFITKTDFCKKAIQDFLEKLKEENNGNINDDDRLFPQYASGESGERKLSRHMEKIIPLFSYSDVKDEGIQYSYKHLLEKINYNSSYNERVKYILKVLSARYDVEEETLIATLKTPQKRSCDLRDKFTSILQILDNLERKKDVLDSMERKDLVRKCFNLMNKMRYPQEQQDLFEKQLCKMIKNIYQGKYLPREDRCDEIRTIIYQQQKDSLEAENIIDTSSEHSAQSILTCPTASFFEDL